VATDHAPRWSDTHASGFSIAQPIAKYRRSNGQALS